jgi:tRNA uridine 5-carbamoylmethylation protein Kti12
MDIKLKNNIIFSTYEDDKLLKERILDFIKDSKTDKILYKGAPADINYKLLKKILPLDQIKFDQSINSINKFVEIKSENVREIYFEFLNEIDCEYCLIYKL